MQYTNRIKAIADRAAAVNLTVSALCRDAEVPYSTIWRWSQGHFSPRASSVAYLDRLEASLHRAERRLGERLCRRAS